MLIIHHQAFIYCNFTKLIEPLIKNISLECIFGGNILYVLYVADKYMVRFSQPKIKEIRKDLHSLENKKIGEIEKNILKLEKSLFKLKKCHGFNEIECRGQGNKRCKKII